MLCKNKGYEHTHATVVESKICWGLLPPLVHRPLPPSVRHATPRQVSYAVNLGGVKSLVERMTLEQASEYIDGLKKGKIMEPTSPSIPRPTPYPAPVRRSRVEDDPRVSMIEAMIAGVPSGYFAVTPSGDSEVTFMRLSRPTRGKFAGTVKLQTQHSDNLVIKATRWPSGRWWLANTDIIELFLLLIADYQGAALRYSQLIHNCCICNKSLTDSRSRHYGIGPDCETRAPWVIAWVDEQNDGRAYSAADA